MGADAARNAVLLRRSGSEGAASEGPRVAGEGEEGEVLAACTFVLHAAGGLCELQLLATSRRYARRGLGTALLHAVERWLRDEGGVACVVALAGLDTVEFWRAKGYTDDVTLSPRRWSLLRDPFGNSRIMSKELGAQAASRAVARGRGSSEKRGRVRKNGMQ